MKHVFRFFSTLKKGDEIYLSGKELQHLHVIRAKVGDELEVFDGCGWVFLCNLQEITCQTAICKITTSAFIPPSSEKITAVIGVQPAKGFDNLLRSMTELGIDKFLIYRHTKDAKFKLKESYTHRWQNIILSASKQCKRAWLPKIEVLGWEKVVEKLKGDFDLILVLDKNGEHSLSNMLSYGLGKETGLMVGSSCGFSDFELSTLRSLGVKFVSLGHDTLRSETAAIFFAGFVSFCRQHVGVYNSKVDR